MLRAIHHRIPMPSKPTNRIHIPNNRTRKNLIRRQERRRE
jgi:hypothetical protein